MMKKILSINLGNCGSTGTIMRGISKIAEERGYETRCAYPNSKNNKPRQKGDWIIGTDFSRRVNGKLAYYTGNAGMGHFFETKAFLRKVEKYQPNVIHLHNLHTSWLYLPLLFRYIKKKNIQVVWTLHDCWAFTGHCTYFDMIGCELWKEQCNNCSIYRESPASLFDNSLKMFKRKRKWFIGVEKMTIVTPSLWLSELVKQSFLKDYSVKVINNGIDLSVFRPVESDFKKKHGIENKKIVLGVAFGWGKRKGLDVFIELSKRLPKEYQIVLVGTDANTDKVLPQNILSIHRTNSQSELAEIYSVADVFANPTREENFPTVNMESLACGTPVVTFKTGGSPEIIDTTCGRVVEKDDVDGLVREILSVVEEKPYFVEACVNRARLFSGKDKFSEYVNLFDEVMAKE